jgi:hypothetical protein
MIKMKFIGKPYEGKPHVRFEEGERINRTCYASIEAHKGKPGNLAWAKTKGYIFTLYSTTGREK